MEIWRPFTFRRSRRPVDQDGGGQVLVEQGYLLMRSVQKKSKTILSHRLESMQPKPRAYYYHVSEHHACTQVKQLRLVFGAGASAHKG